MYQKLTAFFIGILITLTACGVMPEEECLQRGDKNCPVKEEISSNSSALTTVRPLYTNQQLDFLLYPGETVEVHYYPHMTGNKMFYSWHSGMTSLDKVAFVTFYWTDTSKPNDVWHAWKNTAVGYMYPLTSQNLYSGSTSIGFMIKYKNYTDLMLPMHALALPN